MNHTQSYQTTGIQLNNELVLNMLFQVAKLYVRNQYKIRESRMIPFLIC
jgi:hypothetical protein